MIVQPMEPVNFLNCKQLRVRVLFHQKNMGKGAALRTALPYITTPYFIIQDADLEYDPREYSKILKPLIEDRADVVYGSRFVGGETEGFLDFGIQWVINC